jgi:hypothetical protein
LSKIFDSLLESFTLGAEYKKRPPYGPLDELPTLSSDEIAALNFSRFGEDPSKRGNNYRFDRMSFNVEDRLLPRTVNLPPIEAFDDLHIYGISGNNKKVGNETFYFIMAKSSLMSFRYAVKDQKPYFNNSAMTLNAVMVVDRHIFNESAYQDLTQRMLPEGEIYQKFADAALDKPFLVGYKPSTGAAAQALGWGVKLQQILELRSILTIPTDRKIICIKEGPLFSTSVAPQDVAKFLLPTVATWTNQIYIACDDKVQESYLLIEALIENESLRSLWFPGQELTNERLRTIGSDAIILDRILERGQRTPLIEAVARARIGTANEDARLTPLTCYYRSRHHPHPYLRIEIPKQIYADKPALVDEAIEILVWQYELGRKAPLIQTAAKEQAKLESERIILERRTKAALEKHKLNLSIEP